MTLQADGEREAPIEERLADYYADRPDRDVMLGLLARLVCMDDTLHRLEAIFAQLVAKG